MLYNARVKENGSLVPVSPKDKRCSNCVFGHQIVALAAGGSVDDSGNETRWLLNRAIPIGQTRNCFNILQKLFLDPEKFIYPGTDDTCINPQKFKQK